MIETTFTTTALDPNGERLALVYPVLETELIILLNGSKAQRRMIVNDVRRNTNHKTKKK